MGLISEYTEVKVNCRNQRYYKELGYKIPDYDKKQGCLITVLINDVPRYSVTKVNCECDNCHKIYQLSYSDYCRRNHDGKIYCCKCAHAVLHSGKNNNKWNPELTDEEREQRRNIPGYTEFTRKVLKRDNYTCQCCGVINGKLEVHHLNGYNWDKDNRFDYSNVITLCKKCHSNFHDKYGKGNNTKQQFEEWINRVIEYQKDYDGELPPAREVICIEDNTIFSSIQEAAKYANTTSAVINKSCMRQNSIKYGQCTKTVKGKHYLYLDDFNSMTDKELQNYFKWSNQSKTYNNDKNCHPSSKSVVCINTKTVYKSGRLAGKVMKVSNGGISECCRHKKDHCGISSDGEKLIWMYYSEYKKKYNVSDLIHYE